MENKMIKARREVINSRRGNQYVVAKIYILQRYIRY